MMKRKLEPPNSKDKDDKTSKQKAPLIAELIVKVKDLEDSIRSLEADKSKNLDTIRFLENKIEVLEKEKCAVLQQTETKCSDLSLNMENEHSSEDLDSSQGFRVCKRCDYEAEDKYELDGHIWTEHEEDEDGTIFCKFCDEKFANIPNIMIHKKRKHKEKINYCQNYNGNGCPFEDRKCWFLHDRNSETFKCNICEQTFSEKSEFMKHRKNKHPEMVKVCNNNQCIYEKECWFRHTNEDTQMNNIKTNENEKLIEKLVGLVEKLNERVSTLEKK